MPESFLSLIGLAAAGLTSLSYLLQLKRVLPHGGARDISLKMLLVLCLGLSLWVIYGVIKPDWIVAVANGVALALVGAVLACKIRDLQKELKDLA